MMDIAAKNRQIANSYYNLGLEKAKVRDLSGAAQCLKKSLHFSKYQTDARNLLGLIYYENGEVADALVQWVISLNLQPENNLADHYLDEIQRKPGQLETESQNVNIVKRFLPKITEKFQGNCRKPLTIVGDTITIKSQFQSPLSRVAEGTAR